MRPLPTALWYSTKPVRIIEVGVYRGNHAKQMLDSGNVSYIYLIDNYSDNSMFSGDKGDYLEQFAKDYLNEYAGKCKWIRKDSLDVTTDDIQPVDIIYIDGEHTYDRVSKELNHYCYFLFIGGIFCGHDYDIPEVKRAVDEFAKAKNKKVINPNHEEWLIRW
jgi:hypothetical protein